MESRLMIFWILLYMPVIMGFKFTPEICQKYGLGANWYCESAKEEQKEDELASAQDIMEANVPDEAKAEMLNSLWERQRKRAVISGKREDKIAFLDTQHLIANLGVDFAQDIQRLTETIARFNSDGEHGFYKARLDKHLKDVEMQNMLKTSVKRYAIAFVFLSRCGYCKKQLPALLSLKKKWGFKILGISVDGGKHPGLDEMIFDPNVRSDPDVKSFPTLMLIDLKENKRMFLSRGLTTVGSLERLIFNRIKEVADESKS